MLEYKDLLGKKFEYDGRGPETYDCWGLCKEMYKRMGRELYDEPSGRDREKIDEQVQREKVRFRKLTSPEEGCLVALMIRPPLVSHVGVMLNEFQFIHILDNTQVSVERIDNLLWQKRVKGFYVPSEY